jgi:hypothetical protein
MKISELKNSPARKRISEKIKKLYPILYLVLFGIISLRDVGGFHSWRQSQTNFPILEWQANGFSPFNPNIPFIGSFKTWIIEFPIYQWLGYFLSFIIPLKIDYIMRLLAICFAFGSIYIFFKLRAEIKNKYLIILFITTSPYFIYWSTTGLCDWMAIFTSVSGIYSLKKSLAEGKQKKILYTILSLLLLIISGLIKLPLSLLISLFSIIFILTKNSHSNQIKTLFKRLILIFSGEIILSLIWTRWVNSLYPKDDPRHMWTASSDNSFWYFGSRDQYANVFQNVLSVLNNYNKTNNFILFPALLLLVIVIAKETKSIKFVALILVTSVIYVGTFINLNYVHAYYQLPLVFATLLVLVIVFDSKIFSDISKKKIKTGIVAIWMVGLTLSWNSEIGREYNNFSFQLNKQMSNCVTKTQIESPVLVVNDYRGPSMFYECKVEGFNVFTEYPASIDSAVLEIKSYRYAFAVDEPNRRELELFLVQNGGKLGVLLEPGWYEISWNKI